MYASNTSETVAGGISAWLTAEAITSDAPKSSNGFLSNHAVARRNFQKEVGRGRNFSLEKRMAHLGRFTKDAGGFMGAFLNQPRSEGAFASLFFACLMKASGNIRDHAMIAATDQQSYEALRAAGCTIIGYDVQTLLNVEDALGPESLYLSAQDKIVLPQLANIEAIAQTVEENGTLDLDDPELAARQDILTKGVLSFALDMTAYGIQVFGSAKAVPALEPFSITDDPKIIYPFDLPMWETYVPSNSR